MYSYVYEQGYSYGFTIVQTFLRKIHGFIGLKYLFMSRSKRKIKIYKDPGCKYRYNKIYRTSVKQKLITDLKTKELEEIGTLPIQKETTNQYKYPLI